MVQTLRDCVQVIGTQMRIILSSDWGSGWMTGVRLRAGSFSLRSRVHTGSGAHPACYPMGTGRSFPGRKAAGA